MSKTERKKQNADLATEQPQADEHDEEGVAAQQQAQTEQIIQTGAITATKGKYVIHCLTIVGQVAIVGNGRAEMREHRLIGGAPAILLHR